MRQDIAFDAEGVTLRGWLYTDSDAPGPAVVMAPGFASVKEGVCERYADAFAAAGLRVVLFDNRNFGASGGAPRQEADPMQQVRDYRDAITYAGTRAEVDKDRIGVWGSSYSGGHAIVVAAIDRRVKCVVSSVPTISGFEGARRRIHPNMYEALAAQFDADREARFSGATPAMIAIVSKDPAVPAILPGAEAWEALAGENAPGRETWVNAATVRSSEMAIEYDPGHWIDRISPTPLLMIVATHDTQVPSDLALSAYERALQPKELLVIPGGHFDAYDANFEATSLAARDFLVRKLAGKVEFGSDAWMALAEKTLKQVVAERRDAIAGERLTVSETFVNPPAHLIRGGRPELAWSLEIAGGGAIVERRARPDADYRVRADYASTLEGARSVYTTDAAEADARLARRAEATAAGHLQLDGSLDGASPAMQALLVELHNRLARRTA